ncbi:MAG: hypothetical protein IH962_03770 [Chloroflexi bacterium]|nr:hypothetical protein [Chloroflexota bacterium]
MTHPGRQESGYITLHLSRTVCFYLVDDLFHGDLGPLGLAAAKPPVKNQHNRNNTGDRAKNRDD